MIPPRGFEATKRPLHHRFNYNVGLGCASVAENTTLMSLVRNYKTVVGPDAMYTQYKHPSWSGDETGAVCNPMSLLDKFKGGIEFNLTKVAIETDKMTALRFCWFPIWFSFDNLLDVADDVTSTTVATLLGVTKDATEEDVIPTFSGTDTSLAGLGENNHPTSNINLNAEVGTTHLGLTTDGKMEGTDFVYDNLATALRLYTNRKALSASIGTIRQEILTDKRTRIYRKLPFFIPKQVQRIVPYSYFGICTYVYKENDKRQVMIPAALTASSSQITCQLNCSYDEWNNMHIQEMT